MCLLIHDGIKIKSVLVKGAPDEIEVVHQASVKISINSAMLL